MQYQKKEVKERIEEAALTDFLDKGYLNASMRNIANLADISVSNLYNYFESKEKLFYAITDPIVNNLKDLLQQLINAEKKHGSDHFFTHISTLVANPIAELIKKFRRELIVIMDRSKGTKYENFKHSFIKAIEEHIWEDMQSVKTKKGEEIIDPFTGHIIATNLVEAILEISKHYKNEEWVDNNIQGLMKYHTRGIYQFFE